MRGRPGLPERLFTLRVHLSLKLLTFLSLPPAPAAHTLCAHSSAVKRKLAASPSRIDQQLLPSTPDRVYEVSGTRPQAPTFVYIGVIFALPRRARHDRLPHRCLLAASKPSNTRIYMLYAPPTSVPLTPTGDIRDTFPPQQKQT